MQAHDEERDIYGAIYSQGQKYFLLSNKPVEFNRPMWLSQGTTMWEVASTVTDTVKKVEIEDGYDYISVYTASFLVIGSDAIIDLLPVPLTKKVIRFYVTDDEEA